MPPRTFTIKIKYGGLGDHLFYSHLPRIAKQSGKFDRVLISTLSEYRHPDYKRLVWEANPFVDGFCDDDALYPEFFGDIPEGMNLLDYLMILRGLDDGRRYHEPELHFKPEIIGALANTTVYDPNYVSYVGNLEAKHVERYFARKRIIPNLMLKPRAKGLPVRQYGSIIETKDLTHYCSVIASAKRFICLTSGGATLAAALGVPAMALWANGQSSIFHHSKLHEYANVNPTPRHRLCRERVSRCSQALKGRAARMFKGLFQRENKTAQ